MGGRGPAPKSAALRQRTNRKPGAGIIQLVEGRADALQRPIPNPDGRSWHPETIAQWRRAWASPMAAKWLDTDADALGRLATLWDEWNQNPGDIKVMAEIRQQEMRFGFSPLDRTRLQWEIARSDEAERKAAPAEVRKTGTRDPRSMLRGQP